MHFCELLHARSFLFTTLHFRLEHLDMHYCTLMLLVTLTFGQVSVIRP